ncbi:MAG: hypothetical protein H6729_07185 [Deltaproteobacteria bacterium]|nr:hypothetical protein [Deltaproteobacteria bacterium]
MIGILAGTQRPIDVNAASEPGPTLSAWATAAAHTVHVCNRNLGGRYDKASILLQAKERF